MARKKSKPSKPKRGRPYEGRKPLMIHIMPDTVTLMDGMVIEGDSQKNTRGKIVECAINQFQAEL